MNICLVPSFNEQVTGVLTNIMSDELLLNVGRVVPSQRQLCSKVPVV